MNSGFFAQVTQAFVEKASDFGGKGKKEHLVITAIKSVITCWTGQASGLDRAAE
jgi:hypothetical protein